ncbi:ATP-grasp domain-containing protein [Streptomyces xanthii]|uniref:ATP-grasp domain-containing protein n=1 Tax=Streptomyces xanthii TaxID=2768069 RepID=A0A7H1BL50_9ACTN|nr:ATP-grasp domain-containing protein [Streptomyces xanthii]QNS09455.1 ATP-grasp domain-containing protein [Streptomyces xanthii]
MTGAAVLLLDAAGPESAALARAAAGRGHQVHAATATADVPAPAPELAGQVVTDFARPDRAVEEITAYARRRGVGAVLTANEYLTELAALVCTELGLPGNDPHLAYAARDKAAMARVLAAAGVRVPYTRLVHDGTDLTDALADVRVGFPCVIKPVGGAGSAGVTVATSPAEAATAAATARMARGRYGDDAADILVQAYAVGDEYSVESVTQDAHTTHLAITRKAVTGGARRVETGHSLPVHLPPVTEAAVHREVAAAIRSVGIRHGASHTEVVIDPDGRCTVIEIAARLGAGHIGVLLQHALGIDVFAALLDVALGRPAALSPTARGHATVRFVTAPCAGRLTSLIGFPKPGPGVPFVRWRAAIGGVVNAAGVNADRLGAFVVTGPDAAEVEQRADLLARQIRVRVAPTPPAPGGPDQLSSASRSAIAP